MVEITLPIVLQLIQTVALIVGIIYYLTIMRNAEKAKRFENLRMFFDDRKDEDSMLKYAWAMGLEWKDYDDFKSRYWRDTNPEGWARLWSYLVRFDDIGLMLGRGLLHVEDIYEFVGDSLSSLWTKYQPIIEEERKQGDPKTMDWFEYLIIELEKEGKRRGNIT